MSNDSQKKNIAEKAQLVIIGGGGSGLCAALAAHENGVKDVVLLEKRAAFGGNTAFATGFFACESPVQNRSKIVADKDDFFKRTMAWAHWSKINPRIIRAFINKSGDTIRWLEEKGLTFKLVPFYVNQQPLIWHCPEGRAANLTKVLAEECERVGVEMRLKSSVQSIKQYKQGSITKVIVRNEEIDHEITTDTVILATGGFGGNKELLNRLCSGYFQEDMPCRGLSLQGDGIKLASEAGAAIEDSATLIAEGPRMDPNAWPLHGMERDPSTIFINKLGHRFVDEKTGYYPFESVHALLRQPDKICYSLLDANIKEKFESKIPELDKLIDKEAGKDRVKMSDSWNEIANWIGISPDVLKNTIEEYNSFCDKGYDALFAKERRYLLHLKKPPYFAIRAIAVYLDTTGGIRINDKMEVQNRNNETIGGLYAAGVTASGWASETYCGDISGTAFSFALNSGRIAGESAAEFITG